MHPLSQPVLILLLTVATLVLNDRTKIYVPIQFNHPQKNVCFMISIYVALMHFVSISFYFLSTQDDLSLKLGYFSCVFFCVSGLRGERIHKNTRKGEENEEQRVKKN